MYNLYDSNAFQHLKNRLRTFWIRHNITLVLIKQIADIELLFFYLYYNACGESLLDVSAIDVWFFDLGNHIEIVPITDDLWQVFDKLKKVELSSHFLTDILRL